MNTFRIIILFLFVFKLNFSQSIFVPLGSYFTYNYISHDGGTTGIKTLYYTSDTMINAISYKKICTAINYHCVCPNPPIYNSYCIDYLLERNDSLFQYFIGDDILQCLYTFNSNIGDSIVFDSNPSNSNFRYKIVLDSVGSKFVCGVNQQTMYYSKYQDLCPSISTTVTIVKGIGPIDDYLFSQTNGCEVGNGHYSFNCVNTGTCNYPIGNCINEPLAIKQNSNSSSKIFISNNPNGIKVHFSEPVNGLLVIRNMMGNLVFSVDLVNEFSFDYFTNQLAKGIYLVSINRHQKTETSFFTGKFLVD